MNDCQRPLGFREAFGISENLYVFVKSLEVDRAVPSAGRCFSETIGQGDSVCKLRSVINELCENGIESDCEIELLVI